MWKKDFLTYYLGKPASPRWVEETSSNPFAHAQAENISELSYANHSQQRDSFPSFNPYDHVQMEDLPVLFNPIDHAETYSNSLNVLPMENNLFFNPYFHVEATDSFVYLNPTTHPQMVGHTTPPTSYGLVQIFGDVDRG
jgi:hypothetical protein